MANPAALTLITGTRGTDNQNTETRRKRDVSPVLSQLEPDAGPLITFMSQLKAEGATDPKVEWFEDQLLPRFDVLGSAITDPAATSMVVTNYKYFRKGDLVRVNKGEIVLVTTTPSTTTVAIQRAFGETAAATAANSSQLHILYNTNEEGASRRDLLATQRVPQYNYLAIIRDPWGVTKTAMATQTFAGMDFSEEEAKQLIEHKKNCELASIAGERYEDTTGSKPKRGTRGMRNWIATNVTAVNGPLTEQGFDNWLRVTFRFGSKTKPVFLSPIAAQAVNGFAKEKLRVVDSAKTYGVTMTRYENAGRVVLLHEHVLMTNADLNDFSGLAGEALCVDVTDVKMRYLNGRLTVHNQNIQAPDQDQRVDEYLSEYGVQVAQEKKHGLLTGING